jgi:hypothetical protein
LGKGCCKAKCWKTGLLIVIGLAALAWAVMVLWNWLMPTLFADVHQITYLQAAGLLVLSRILIGGFRGHGCPGRWRHHKRLEQMSPGEREKFQAGMRGCCGSSKQNDDATA